MNVERQQSTDRYYRAIDTDNICGRARFVVAMFYRSPSVRTTKTVFNYFRYRRDRFTVARRRDVT
jgi:hypothetical protein